MVYGLEGPTGTIDLGKNLGKHFGFYNILLIFDHGGTIEDYRFGAKKSANCKKNHNVPLAERLRSRLFVQKPQVQVWERDLFSIIVLIFISTKKSCVLCVVGGFDGLGGP